MRKKNEKQNIAIEGILKLYTATMLNNIKKDPLKAVNKIQENLAEILKLKIEKNNLQNRIDKAIEYIEMFDIEHLHEICEHNLVDTLEVLLDILKENGE